MSITPEIRANTFFAALNLANQCLEEDELEVGFGGMWPNNGQGDFDERPEVELKVRMDGIVYPIDLVYMRQMPIEPEQLKTVEQLSQDIVKKVRAHFQWMNDPHILFSSKGTKFYSEDAIEKGYRFSFDAQEYIRINGLRIAMKREDQYRVLKAGDLRSHTIIRVCELSNLVLHITDDFEEIRTDGRAGFICSVEKAVTIAKELLTSNVEYDKIDQYYLMERK